MQCLPVSGIEGEDRKINPDSEVNLADQSFLKQLPEKWFSSSYEKLVNDRIVAYHLRKSAFEK